MSAGMGGSMGGAGSVPSGTLTRREFVGWILAGVAAMIAGSAVWRLFRSAMAHGEHEIPLTVTRAYGSGLIRDAQYGIADWRVGDPFVLVRGGEMAARGVVTDISRGAITVAWT